MFCMGHSEIPHEVLTLAVASGSRYPRFMGGVPLTGNIYFS